MTKRFSVDIFLARGLTILHVTFWICPEVRVAWEAVRLPDRCVRFDL